MGDLISRKDAIDIMNAKGDVALGTQKAVFYSAAHLLELMPAVEAEPVRRGKWERRTYWIGSFGENQMVCSECGKKYGFHAPYNYCPNCGAKMEEG